MIKTVVSSSLPVDEQLNIRKNSITGGSGGKRICIVTGTHGDELEGQYICFQLVHLLRENAQLLDGIVDIYPALNPLGIDSITRGIPNFDLDMNRIFPGDPNGSMAESTAYALIEDLKGADMVIDIHSSNIFLREVPQVRININTAELLVPYAKLLNTDFIWIHEAATVLEATLAHSLNALGTPTLVVEMGVGMRINRKYCNRLFIGILHLMQVLGFWKGEITDEITEPVLSTNGTVDFLNASASGVFISSLNNSMNVKKGQEIGRIVNSLTGDILQQVCSPKDGFLFTLRAYPIVYEGSLLARIYSNK